MKPAARTAARTFAALVALAAVALPALPAHAAIDPLCNTVVAEGAGFVTVEDPTETPAGLAPQVSTGDMSCILAIAGTNLYAYLSDPAAKLVSTALSLVADGWTLTEVLDDDSEIPFDIATVQERAAGEQLNLLARRGPDTMAVSYFADAAISDFFAAGTFMAAFPLQAAPATAGGVGIADPSSLSELRALRAPTVAQGGTLVGVAAGLTVLLALPAFLLSNVLSSRYQQWFDRLARGPLGRARAALADAARGRRRWIVLIVGMVLSSFIAGFIDPAYGFNLMSLRMFLTLLVTFAVFNIGAWAVITAVLRRVQPDAKPVLTMHPATVLVVALAVLVSRLLQFNPGIVFGLVAGVTFALTLLASREALVILVGSGYAVAVALVAWTAYSLIPGAAGSGNPLLVALGEFLAGVTLEGVSTLPLALLPLAALDGATLFRWKKWVWAVAYALGLVLFMYALFTVPGGSGVADGDFVRWIVIFAVFVAVALAAWGVDWALRRREGAREVAEETSKR